VSNNEHHKHLDVYVKTTELSHGFCKKVNYETSSFYLDAGHKLLVDIEDEERTPVACEHSLPSAEGRSVFWYPFYFLGWTSVTSYSIEYLSGNDSLTVCGVVDYNVKTSQFQIAEPVMVCLGSIKDALASLQEKFIDNAKWAVVYGALALAFGSLCLYQFKSVAKNSALKIEKAGYVPKCVV